MINGCGIVSYTTNDS